jgi:ubiquinone/menaquinone biosynthesis C-methylase UbiE
MASTKAFKGPAMEGRIAAWYARNTRGDPRHRATAETLTAGLAPGARVLEVAPGPGYLAIEIARRGAFRVNGLDISTSFVSIAQENAKQAGVDVDFKLGNASAMPFQDESFDLVVCQAAFKNFTDPLGALNETWRVLGPGGRAVIHDLRKETTLDEVRHEVQQMGLSWLSTRWTRLTFRFFLLKNAYTEPALQDLVARSSFRSGEILRNGIGFELRLSKPAG